ncbi:MAG: hypothetical protein K6E39_02780 [Lachnospiraceae bacterium]|nr:hypothetical protein [Lachnospiraceae bacterium]
MGDKELKAKEILSKAVEDTIEFASNTKAPIADIVYQSHIEYGEKIMVYVLFDRIEDLQAMEENNLKDSFMEVFIKALTKYEFPFKGAPRLSFEFSINI